MRAFDAEEFAGGHSEHFGAISFGVLGLSVAGVGRLRARGLSSASKASNVACGKLLRIMRWVDICSCSAHRGALRVNLVDSTETVP